MRGTQNPKRVTFPASAGLALCLVLAANSRAAPFVDVQYDLGDTTGTVIWVLPLLGFFGTVLDAEHFTGTQTVRYSSNSGSSAVDGPVSIRSFDLTIKAPNYTSTLTGALQLASASLHLQITNHPLAGTLSGGAVNPAESALMRVTGQFHCSALCAPLGVAITADTPIQPSTFLVPLRTLVTSNGASMIQGVVTPTFSVDPGEPSTVLGRLPVTFVIVLAGREVARTPVPEPGTLGLLSVGLGALASAGGAGWVARRWRG